MSSSLRLVLVLCLASFALALPSFLPGSLFGRSELNTLTARGMLDSGRPQLYQFTHAGTAVTASDLASYNLYEQYAAAAYCESNNNSTGTKLTCFSGNCPLVESANTITVHEFEK